MLVCMGGVVNVRQRERCKPHHQSTLLSAQNQLDPSAGNRERLRIFFELMGARGRGEAEDG